MGLIYLTNAGKPTAKGNMIVRLYRHGADSGLTTKVLYQGNIYTIEVGTVFGAQEKVGIMYRITKGNSISLFCVYLNIEVAPDWAKDIITDMVEMVKREGYFRYEGTDGSRYYPTYDTVELGGIEFGPVPEDKYNMLYVAYRGNTLLGYTSWGMERAILPEHDALELIYGTF